MATRLTEVEQPKGTVTWVLANDQLSQYNFQTPELKENRYLSVSFGDEEIGIGISALPPSRKPHRGFWSVIAQRLGRGEKLPATRLRIEPLIPYDEALPGLHTPISAMHPYVVMENGTRYGVAVWIPKSMIGEWSAERERPQGGNDLFKLHATGKVEVYRQRQNVALLVRLNGDTPIAEQRIQMAVADPIRREMLIGVSDTPVEGNDYTSSLVTKRQVLLRDNSSVSTEGNGEKQPAETYDLVFNTVAKRGTKENATFDQKGLVDVIVATCTDDEVTEIRTQPISYPKVDSDFGGGYSGLRSFGGFGTRSLDLGVTKGGFRDSTVKGETSFTNREVQKVNIRTVRELRPIARFRLSLVGSGGPILATMSEAPVSTSGVEV